MKHLRLFENFDPEYSQEEGSRISQERDSDQWSKVEELANRFLEETDCSIDFDSVEEWLRESGEDTSYSDPIMDYLKNH